MLELLKPKTAYIHTADANLDLTSGNLPAVSRLIITGSGFTASKNVTLPSAGVIAGEVFEIHNRSTSWGCTVKASDGSTINSNSKVFFKNGKALLMSLQTTPTTSAHWRVLEISEEGSYTPVLQVGSETNCSGVSGDTSYYKRDGNTVTVWGSFLATATSPSNYSACRLTLPIDRNATNFTNTNNLVGTTHWENNSPQQHRIVAYTSDSNKGTFNFFTTNSGSQRFHFYLTYKLD